MYIISQLTEKHMIDWEIRTFCKSMLLYDLLLYKPPCTQLCLKEIASKFSDCCNKIF